MRLSDTKLTEPTPAAEAAARAKEAAEQAALPYKWAQTIGDIDVTIKLGEGSEKYKGKDLKVEIKKQHLTAGVKGSDPIIDVRDLGTFERLFVSLTAAWPILKCWLADVTC